MKESIFYIRERQVKLVLFDTNAEMLEYAESIEVYDLTKDTLGAFVPAKDDDKVGWIFITRDNAFMHIIAHECGHCAIEYMRKNGIKKIRITFEPAGIQEERFLHLQSNIILYVGKELIKFGL